jgi:hypothetical protein
VRPHSIIKILAAAALIAVPTLATAAPDQNTPGNNGCNGQWVNGQCVNNGQNNGRWNNGNNGRWNNNGRHHDRDGDNDRDDHHDRGRHNGWNNPNNPHSGYNNGGYNNGGYNNGYGGYNNGYGGYNNGYGNGYGGNGTLNGTVSSFSPYNLYLSNGLHVVLHDGTVINPRGTNLTGGQRVRVIGYRQQDGTFAANEIDVIGSGYNNGYYRR